MSERQLIVVDIETSSLDVSRAVALEIAAVNVATGEEFYFAPWIKRELYSKFDADALEVNRYFERGVFREAATSDRANEDALEKLADMLAGNTLAGSNPAYDAAVLRRHLAAHLNEPQPWHYRLADLAAYAAGRFGLPPTETPGLSKVCELLGVTNDDPHTAMGDARATAECFRRLMASDRP